MRYAGVSGVTRKAITEFFQAWLWCIALPVKLRINMRMKERITFFFRTYVCQNNIRFFIRLGRKSSKQNEREKGIRCNAWAFI
jgi:hypothetical protein